AADDRVDRHPTALKRPRDLMAHDQGRRSQEATVASRMDIATAHPGDRNIHDDLPLARDLLIDVDVLDRSDFAEQNCSHSSWPTPPMTFLQLSMTQSVRAVTPCGTHGSAWKPSPGPISLTSPLKFTETRPSSTITICSCS